MAARGLTGLLRRDRLVIASALALLTLLSWLQMLLPESAGGSGLMPCCGARFDVAFSMWIVMMAGMMIPSVAPMVITHAAIVRRRTVQGAPFVASGLFLGGYLVAWSGFSAVAAGAQWLLFRSPWFDKQSLSIAPWAGALVLLATCIFQLTPAKNACLSQCRAPVGYFITNFREGRWGALRMGLHHGAFCIGCCWLLMAVLFVVGIMNVVWGAVITAFVVAEKILPWPRGVVWTGAFVCLLGAFVLVHRAMLGA